MEHITDIRFIFNPFYIILFTFEAKIHGRTVTVKSPKEKINMIKVEPENYMNCLNSRELIVNES